MNELITVTFDVPAWMLYLLSGLVSISLILRIIKMYLDNKLNKHKHPGL